MRLLRAGAVVTHLAHDLHNSAAISHGCACKHSCDCLILTSAVILLDLPATPRPTWSLSGIVIDVAAGATASIHQSAWTPDPKGWASVLTLNVGERESTQSKRTAQLLVTHALPEAIAPELAKTLIAFRLRAMGPNPPKHLGDIYVR